MRAGSVFSQFGLSNYIYDSQECACSKIKFFRFWKHRVSGKREQMFVETPSVGKGAMKRTVFTDSNSHPPTIALIWISPVGFCHNGGFIFLMRCHPPWRTIFLSKCFWNEVQFNNVYARIEDEEINSNTQGQMHVHPPDPSSANPLSPISAPIHYTERRRSGSTLSEDPSRDESCVCFRCRWRMQSWASTPSWRRWSVWRRRSRRWRRRNSSSASKASNLRAPSVSIVQPCSPSDRRTKTVLVDAWSLVQDVPDDMKWRLLSNLDMSTVFHFSVGFSDHTGFPSKLRVTKPQFDFVLNRAWKYCEIGQKWQLFVAMLCRDHQCKIQNQ